MLSKSEIQLFSKLNLKKFRDSEKLFVVEGKRLVSEGLNSNYNCLLVAVSNQFNDNEKEFLSNLKVEGIRFEVERNKELQKMTSTKNPQGIIALFEIPKKKVSDLDDNIIIGLENISDPGNLGTILRSCVWFGIKTVFLSTNCADVYNPKVLRASMGAVFKLNLVENMDLIKTINNFKDKGYRALYADMSGKDYRSIEFNSKTILTFCNEAFGPTDELKKVCDLPITIPQKGDIDSLNVAAAAAVILAEMASQQ